MRMFYAITFRLRCKNPKLYIFSVWIMDQSKKSSEVQENKEASLSACNQYKMFLEHINGLKPSLLRTQLSELLYPLYVHLFLLLLRENKCSKYAQEFLEKFHFIAHTKPQEIKIMRNSSTARDVFYHFQFKSYRKGSIGIKFTESNYDHLQKWLEVNQPFLISKLLKENFHKEILNERLGKADAVIPPKEKARSEEDITLDELIISRKRPPDPEISDESSEESCVEDETCMEDFDDISSITSGSEISDIEESSNTKVNELPAKISNDIVCSKPSHMEEPSSMEVDVPTKISITNGTETSDAEEMNEMDVDDLSIEVTLTNGRKSSDIEESNYLNTEASVTNECSKTAESQKLSNMDVDDILTITPITNGIEIYDSDELNNVETDDLSTRVIPTNGIEMYDSEELNNVETDDLSTRVIPANDCLLDDISLTSEDCWLAIKEDSNSIASCEAEKSEVGSNCEDPNFGNVAKNSKYEGYSEIEGDSLSLDDSDSNSIFSQSRNECSTSKNKNVVDQASWLSCKDSTDNKSVTEKEGVVDQASLLSCKDSIDNKSATEKEVVMDKAPFHPCNGISTFGQRNFFLRHCRVLIQKIDGVNGIFCKNNSTCNLDSMPAISSSHKRATNLPERKRKCSLAENGTTEVKGKKPYKDCNGAVGSSNTLCNGFADSSSSLDSNESVTEKEESLVQVKPVMTEKAMPRVGSDLKDTSKMPTSSILKDKENNGAKCISSIIAQKDKEDTPDTSSISTQAVGKSEDTPGTSSISTQAVRKSKDTPGTSSISTQAVGKSKDTPGASSISTQAVRKSKTRWKVCAPCLVKKTFRSRINSQSEQSAEYAENQTDMATKNLIRAFCSLDPAEKETSFEYHLSNETFCLPTSKADESELNKILEKCKIQSNKSPFLPTEVPIRVLNIESDENLHCSVIAKDLSYVACAFEKSMYIWRSMEKIPNKYFLYTKHVELSKENAFVPKNKRMSGVSASSQTPYLGSVHCLACNPLTNTFLLGSESTIECWCPMKNKCLSTYKCHTDQVNNIHFRSNSTDFISTSMDKRAIVWDFETSIPKCLYSHDDAVKMAVVHPKCPYLVTATSREIHIWIEGSPSSQSVCKDHKADITGIAFSPSGDHLASCDKSGLVYVWDMKKRQRFNSFSVTKEGVGHLCYNSSVENTVLATAGLDNTLRLYSGGNSSNAAVQRIPIFTAECRNSSTLNSVQFSNTDELVEITYTLKKSYKES